MADQRISLDASAGALDGSEIVPLVRVGSPVTAGSFVVGTAYFILSIGTTDFTLIGAASNTVGIGFVATGAGSGTGTAGATSNVRSTTQTVANTASTMVGDSGSGGTKGLVPAPGSGDAAAGKFLKADATWATPTGGGGSVAGYLQPVNMTTSTALAANTYANGTAGVGATLTGNSNGALGTIDGIAPSVGLRILVKNEATAAHNGIYTVTQVGDASHPYILTRATDFDTAAEMLVGSIIPTLPEGSLRGKSIFVFTTDGTITVGTTGLTFEYSTVNFPALVDQGAFNNTNSYTAGAVVTSSGRRYLAKIDLAPPAGVADAWDATFGSTKFTVGGTGNLTATATDHNHTDTIISTKAQTSGKLYFGMKWNSSGDLYVGIGTAALTNATRTRTITGNEAVTLENNNPPTWWFNGSGTSSGMPLPTNGDWIAFVFDLSNGHAWVSNFTANPGTWYGNNGTGDPVTGTNPFTFTALGANTYVVYCSDQNSIDETMVYEEGSKANTNLGTPPSGSSYWGGAAGTLTAPAGNTDEWIDIGQDSATLNDLTDVVIASPTDGQLLTYDLATTSWKNKDQTVSTGSPAMSLVANTVASSSATIDFTGLDNTAIYEITGNLVLPATSAVDFQMQFGTGSTPTWSGASYNFAGAIQGSGNFQTHNEAESAAQFTLFQSVGNTSVGCNFKLRVIGGEVIGILETRSSDGHYYSSNFGGSWTGGTMTAIRFKFASGNIASGNIAVHKLSTTATVVGLFAQVLSVTPTISNTGLATWLNQNGATFVDGATGCCLKQTTNTGSFSVNARLKTAPATPYTLTGFFVTNTPAPTSSNYAGFIWYDGTNKCHLFGINSGSILIGKANTPTSYSANDSITSSGFSHFTPIWLQISDDGTNVSFRYSTDGVNWITLQTTAKSSAWLGSSGYSNVGIFLDAQNSQMMTTLLSLAQT